MRLSHTAPPYKVPSSAGEEGNEDIVLIDVCPLTLGIEATGGVTTKLIPRNTVIQRQVEKGPLSEWTGKMSLSNSLIS